MKRQCFLIQVLAPGEDPRGDAPVVRGSNDHKVVRATGIQHSIPHVLGIERRIPQINLITLLTGKSSLRNDHIAPANLSFHEPVVGNVANFLAKEVHHECFRLRTLDLHRSDIDLANGDIESEAQIHTSDPHFDIAIGEREPKLVLGKP